MAESVPYTVVFNSHGERRFKKLSREGQARLAPEIRKLAWNPHATNPKVTQLVNRGKEHRLKVPGFRVLYEIDEPTRTVTITEAFPRERDYD